MQKTERQVLLAILLCFLNAQFVYRVTLSHPSPVGSGPRQGIDFGAYYLAAKAAAGGGHPDLYSLPLYADGRLNTASPAPAGSSWQAAARQYGVPLAMPFLYPPVTALLLQPLARLRFAAAHELWLVLAVFLYLLGAGLSFRLCGLSIGKRMFLPASAGLLCFFPLLDELLYGQIDSVIFVLLAGSFFLLSHRKIGGAGLLFAVAALVKLTPFLLLPIFVIHRQWRFSAACAFWAAALVGASALHLGWRTQWEFVAHVLPHMGCGSPTVTNASLTGFVQQLMAGRVFIWAEAPAQLPPHACAISRGISEAIYSVVLLRMWQLRKRRGFMRDGMAGILLSLLVSPISWWHHYLAALLPLLFFARDPRSPAAGWARGLLLLVATNVAGWGAMVSSIPWVRLSFIAVVPLFMFAVLGVELFGGASEAEVPVGHAYPVEAKYAG